MTILSSSRANLNCLKKSPIATLLQLLFEASRIHKDVVDMGTAYVQDPRYPRSIGLRSAEQDVFGHTFPETAKQPWITWIFQHFFHQNSPTEKRSWFKLRHVPRPRIPRNPTAGQGREQLKNLRLGVISSEKCQGKSQGNSINGRQHLRNISILAFFVKSCYRSASYTEVTMIQRCQLQIWMAFIGDSWEFILINGNPIGPPKRNHWSPQVTAIIKVLKKLKSD